MTMAINIARGRFGRVALLDMDKPLVRHAHPQIHVLQKIKGSDQVFVVDGIECRLSDDTAVLVNTWSEHYYPHADHIGNTVCLALYIEPSWLTDLDSCLKWSKHPGFFDNPCVTITPNIKEKSRAIADELSLETQLDPSAVESLVFDLTFAYIDLFSSWREMSESNSCMPSMNDFRIRRALKHLHEEKGLVHDVGELVSIAALSRPRFFELFKLQTGLTPIVYANALRVESALNKLGRSSSPIVDISFDHGFDEQSNFTRFFRQHVGVPPAAYRKTVTEFASV